MATQVPQNCIGPDISLKIHAYTFPSYLDYFFSDDRLLTDCSPKFCISLPSLHFELHGQPSIASGCVAYRRLKYFCVYVLRQHTEQVGVAVMSSPCFLDVCYSNLSRVARFLHWGLL